MAQSWSEARRARHARALERLAAGVGSSFLATAALAAPPVVASYVPLNFGTTPTFLTGIRGGNIVGNYVIPGTTETGGLYYDLDNSVWSAMPLATANGANFPGAIGSSPYGPSFGSLDGVLRTVGSYQTETSAPYDLSYLFDAAAAPGQDLTTLIYPGGADETLFTIAHSTFGNQVVGNYDTRLATGNAFIYDIDTGSYTTNNIPGAISTTAYGIYGDMIAGGYGQVMAGDGFHLEHGYIFDQSTGTYATYDHPLAVATHFEGITGGGKSGEYNLVANWVTADGTVHPAVMHLDALGRVTWYEIDFIPGAVVSSNSAFGDNVVGIYVDDSGINGYLATIPGIYNPIRNTGTTTSAAPNDAALSGRKGDDIINSGTVEVSGAGGIGIRGETFGVLTNTGTVTATGLAGAAVEMHGRFGTLLNKGTLRAPAVADALRTGADAVGSVIVNTGIIDGRIAATAGAGKRFENSGVIGVTGTGVPITHLLSGTFVQTPSGTLGLRVTDSGSDVLGLTGTGQLAGQLTTSFQTTSFAPTFTVIAATEGISGTFDSVETEGLAALFTTTLTYAPAEVTMQIVADNTGLPNLSANQAEVATAVDGIINTTTGGLLTSLPEALSPLYDLGTADLPGALSALSGEGYATSQTLLLGESRYSRTAILGRLRQDAYADREGALSALAEGGPTLSSSNDTSASDGTFWLQAYGNRTDLQAENGISGASQNTGGLIAGADVLVNDWTLGAAIGYAQASSSLDDVPTSFDTDSLVLAVYGGTTVGPWNLRLGASYASSQIDADRTIAAPGFGQQAQASYDAGTTQLFAEAGYGIAVQGAAIEPFANLSWVSVHTDGFSETGAAAGLSGESTSSSVGYGTLGVRVASSIALADGTVFMPRGSLGWQNAFGDLSPLSELAFLSAPGAGFTAGGIPVARNTALVEIGADLVITAQSRFGLSYIGQFADGVSDNGVQATVTWQF